MKRKTSKFEYDLPDLKKLFTDIENEVIKGIIKVEDAIRYLQLQYSREFTETLRKYWTNRIFTKREDKDISRIRSERYEQYVREIQVLYNIGGNNITWDDCKRFIDNPKEDPRLYASNTNKNSAGDVINTKGEINDLMQDLKESFPDIYEAINRGMGSSPPLVVTEMV